MQKETLFNRDVFVYKERPHAISEMFEETVRKHGTREAVVTEKSRLTYEELSKSVDQVALYFQHHCHLKKGDRVALLMENRLEFIQVFLACAKLGIIVVPLNAKSSADELLFMMNHADVQLICAESGFESMIEQWQDGQQKQFVILTDGTNYNGIYEPFETIFKESMDSVTLDVPKMNEEDPLYIIFTSGTTGNPKGAIGSHVNVIHSVINYKKVLKMKSPARTLIAVPLFHVTGLIGQFFYMILIGGTNVLMNRYQTGNYLQLIEQEKITFLFNVPTIYIMMLNHKSFNDTKIDSVEIAAYGGAPMSKETIERLMNDMPGISLHNAYGASETSSPASIMPKESTDWSKIGSVGKPVPVAEMKIVDEFGESLGVEEVGELYIKGPMIIEGYWRNEEANETNFIDGYWKSGDMAMFDEESYLYIMDRRKDMINRGGEKVFSAEVENVLYDHVDVLEAAVVGIPDTLFGEAVKAYIVPKENKNPDPDDVKAFLHEQLARFKVPEQIEVIKELPRNAGGKILKGQLIKYD